MKNACVSLSVCVCICLSMVCVCLMGVAGGVDIGKCVPPASLCSTILMGADWLVLQHIASPSTDLALFWLFIKPLMNQTNEYLQVATWVHALAFVTAASVSHAGAEVRDEN